MRDKDAAPENGAREEVPDLPGLVPGRSDHERSLPVVCGTAPLPLRGAGGKFLPGLTPTKTDTAGRRRVVVLVVLLVVVPLAVLGECDGPMFPDGILPAANLAAPPIGPVLFLVLVLALALALALALVVVVLVAAGVAGGWPRDEGGRVWPGLCTVSARGAR